MAHLHGHLKSHHESGPGRDETYFLDLSLLLELVLLYKYSSYRKLLFKHSSDV